MVVVGVVAAAGDDAGAGRDNDVRDARQRRLHLRQSLSPYCSCCDDDGDRHVGGRLSDAALLRTGRH